MKSWLGTLVLLASASAHAGIVLKTDLKKNGLFTFEFYDSANKKEYFSFVGKKSYDVEIANRKGAIEALSIKGHSDQSSQLLLERGNKDSFSRCLRYQDIDFLCFNISDRDMNQNESVLDVTYKRSWVRYIPVNHKRFIIGWDNRGNAVKLYSLDIDGKKLPMRALVLKLNTGFINGVADLVPDNGQSEFVTDDDLPVPPRS